MIVMVIGATPNIKAHRMWLIATRDFTFKDRSYLTGERFEMGLRDAFTITKQRHARATKPEPRIKTAAKAPRPRRRRKAAASPDATV